jgi:hypothetical protein
VQWHASSGAQLTLSANLSAGSVTGFPDMPGHLLWEEGQVGTDGTYPPWCVRWVLRT